MCTCSAVIRSPNSWLARGSWLPENVPTSVSFGCTGGGGGGGEAGRDPGGGGGGGEGRSPGACCTGWTSCCTGCSFAGCSCTGCSCTGCSFAGCSCTGCSFAGCSCTGCSFAGWTASWCTGWTASPFAGASCTGLSRRPPDLVSLVARFPSGPVSFTPGTPSMSAVPRIGAPPVTAWSWTCAMPVTRTYLPGLPFVSMMCRAYELNLRARASCSCVDFWVSAVAGYPSTARTSTPWPFAVSSRPRSVPLEPAL
ncbi:pentapeptide repeat-containing protein [Kitasatospora cineracea]|uniref:pentapeptide repeat-containing protein n=1 Tax=Kitasatospora cineracea TaxID=88074 RepID=UPI0037AB51DC